MTHIIILLQIQHGRNAGFAPKPLDVVGAFGIGTNKDSINVAGGLSPEDFVSLAAYLVFRAAAIVLHFLSHFCKQ